MVKKFNIFDSQLDESVVLTDKAKLSLYKKSQNSGISVDILEEVYNRGYRCWTEAFGGTPNSFAFDRVNSFIAGGFAVELDEDLKKACWKGYEAIGMKKKNGKTVPNCVPVKEQLNQPTPSVETVAKKFDKSVDYIKRALVKGTKVEKEHTKKPADAREIALDHLGERPDYYTKLQKMEKSPIKEDGIVGHIGAGQVGGPEPHSKDFRKPSSRFIGSNELVTIYKSMTPGQIIKQVVREAVQSVDEGDVIRTKFATKNMQKRGIAGPKPIEGEDIHRLWATSVTAPDDGQIAYHGQDARIISKGKHTDIKHGAMGAFSSGEHKASVVRKQAPKKKGNVVSIKQAVKEATYQGREVPLNKPMKGDVKKSKVFVDPDGDGKAQKVNFGDKHLSIKKDQPARKKSYCARSGGIKGKRDVTSANYWSRKAWDCSEQVGDELPMAEIEKRRKAAESSKTSDVFARMKTKTPRGLVDLSRDKNSGE